MNRVRGLFVVLLLVVVCQAAAETRFMAVDVYIDSDAPLAAWQFEFADLQGSTKIVGIENGETPVFNAAPFYDRDAVAGGNAERLVIADYSMADRAKLPTGRTRVATLHLMVSGDTEFASTLVVAATHGGKKIEAEISVEISAGRNQ